MSDIRLQSAESTCWHSIYDFINLGGVWYPFCNECKRVVEVEPPEEPSSLEDIIRKVVKEELKNE